MSEAQELWDALGLKEHEQVIGAVLVGKIKNFESGQVTISTATTDDVDWVDQIGILRSGTLIIEGAEIPSDE